MSTSQPPPPADVLEQQNKTNGMSGINHDGDSAFPFPCFSITALYVYKSTSSSNKIHPWTRANDNYCAINQVRCIWVVHTCSGITYTKVSFSPDHLHCTCNQKTMSICTKHVWYNTLYMSFSISEIFQAEKGDVPKWYKELCRPHPHLILIFLCARTELPLSKFPR